MNTKVYREARELVKMPHGMIPTKNLYENSLIREMIEPIQREEQTQKLIDEYI